jgi:hypothetical protein
LLQWDCGAAAENYSELHKLANVFSLFYTIQDLFLISSSPRLMVALVQRSLTASEHSWLRATQNPYAFLELILDELDDPPPAHNELLETSHDSIASEPGPHATPLSSIDPARP